MPEQLKHPINIRLTDRQYEYFWYITMQRKEKMSEVIRTFIDSYIEKHIDIIKDDDAHIGIQVLKDNGKIQWMRVRKDQLDKNYVHIGNSVFKKKK